MERIFVLYLRIMTRISAAVRPNKFSKWEKWLALYIPMSMRNS